MKKPAFEVLLHSTVTEPQKAQKQHLARVNLDLPSLVPFVNLCVVLNLCVASWY